MSRRVMAVAALAGATSAFAGAHFATSSAPVTPIVQGAYNPQVTPATVASTVCVRGWTATVRPPVSWSGRVKRELAASQHVNARDYELDHLISLEIGGAPRSIGNVWLQPWSQARRDDDGIEAQLHRELCAGEITLRAARRRELDYKEKNG